VPCFPAILRAHPFAPHTASHSSALQHERIRGLEGRVIRARHFNLSECDAHLAPTRSHHMRRRIAPPSTVGASEGWRGELCEPASPSQLMQLALVWPIICTSHQSGAHGIAANIFPFLVIVIAPSQLSVPAIALPQWFILLNWPCPSHRTTPVLHPRLERCVWISWAREEVDVVWHENIPADMPTVRTTPRVQNQFVRGMCAQ
jgi:hypothetical protein